MGKENRLAKRRQQRDLKPLSAPILSEEQKRVHQETLSAQPMPAPKLASTAPVIETPKQPNVLTPEQTQQARGAMTSRLGRRRAERMAPVATPQQKIVTQPADTRPIISTPQQNGVLTPEQTQQAKDSMAEPIRAEMEAKNKEALKRLSLADAASMVKKESQKQKNKNEADEEKRRKREALFSALGDGIAAMSNLYFATQGAPSVTYDPRTSLSARAKARWDAIDAERKADAEKAYATQQQAYKQYLDEAKQRRVEERQAKKDLQDDEYRKEQLAQQQRHHEQTMEYNRERDERDMRAKLAQFAKDIEVAKIRNANSKASGGSGKSTAKGDYSQYEEEDLEQYKKK